jgi:SAM-dependent methyltransferase
MTIDLSRLDPAVRARQLGHPIGDLGLAVAAHLNRSNAKVLARAFAALQPRPGQRVFEVGFGNGHTIPDVLGLAPQLRYAGIDISETMVEEAARFNAAAVADGRVEVRVGSSAHIPFDNAAFDVALVINVSYFWAEPARDLTELRRVLKPGARLVLGTVSATNADRNPMAKLGFSLYSRDQLERLLRAAGFADLSFEVTRDVRTLDGVSFEMEYFIISGV